MKTMKTKQKIFIVVLFLFTAALGIFLYINKDNSTLEDEKTQKVVEKQEPKKNWDIAKIKDEKFKKLGNHFKALDLSGIDKHKKKGREGVLIASLRMEIFLDGKGGIRGQLYNQQDRLTTPKNLSKIIILLENDEKLYLKPYSNGLYHGYLREKTSKTLPRTIKIWGEYRESTFSGEFTISKYKVMRNK